MAAFCSVVLLLMAWIKIEPKASFSSHNRSIKVVMTMCYLWILQQHVPKYQLQVSNHRKEILLSLLGASQRQPVSHSGRDSMLDQVSIWLNSAELFVGTEYIPCNRQLQHILYVMLSTTWGLLTSKRTYNVPAVYNCVTRLLQLLTTVMYITETMLALCHVCHWFHHFK